MLPCFRPRVDSCTHTQTSVLIETVAANLFHFPCVLFCPSVSQLISAAEKKLSVVIELSVPPSRRPSVGAFGGVCGENQFSSGNSLLMNVVVKLVCTVSGRDECVCQSTNGNRTVLQHCIAPGLTLAIRCTLFHLARTYIFLWSLRGAFTFSAGNKNYTSVLTAYDIFL